MNNHYSDPPKLILFDVYETILDMADVERKINSFLDSKRGYILWFELFMQYTLVDNFNREFHSFSSIAEATLRMTAENLGEKITSDQIKEILDSMKHLPISEGVQEGLSGISDQGYRIAALTNVSESIVKERMLMSGLVSYFEKVFSAETIRKYKPSLEVYLWATEKLEVNASEILFVSSHGWDIIGARNAGMQSAYVQKRRQLLYPLAPVPNYTCKNLVDLCNQLKSKYVIQDV